MFIKPHILTLIKLSITLIIFVYFFKKFELNDIYNSYYLSDICLTLFVCTFIISIQVLICSYRLTKISNSVHAYLNIKSSWVATSIGGVYSHTPLSFIGGDIIRIMDLSKTMNLSKTKTSGIVIFDRIIGLTGLVVLCLLFFPFFIFKFINLFQNNSELIITLLFIVPLLILILIFIFRDFIYRIINKIKQKLNKANFFINEIKKVLLTILILSILSYIFAIIGFLSINSFLNLKINIITLILCIPYAILVTLIPISIGGWGVREGSFILLLHISDSIPANVSLVLSITYGICIFLAFIPGSIFYFLKKRI